jgi:hypothetical protein
MYALRFPGIWTFVPPDTQKSHPCRSQCRAEQTSISPAVVSPPFIGATPTSGRGAASSYQFARRNRHAFAKLKRSIARSICAARRAERRHPHDRCRRVHENNRRADDRFAFTKNSRELIPTHVGACASLVLIAAVIHARWNFLAKKTGGAVRFVLLTCIAPTIVWSPVGLWFVWRDAATFGCCSGAS